MNQTGETTKNGTNSPANWAKEYVGLWSATPVRDQREHLQCRRWLAHLRLHFSEPGP